MSGHSPDFHNRFSSWLLNVVYILELLVSICLIGGILISLVPIAKEVLGLYSAGGDLDGFTSLLSNLFGVVIGIEFLKMLCSFDMDSVIEVLLFTIARQMVLNHATPMEQLFSIASIAILFVIRKFLFVKQLDSERHGKKQSPEQQ